MKAEIIQSRGQPSFIQTPLGWVISGSIPCITNKVYNNCAIINDDTKNLLESLQRLWKLDEICAPEKQLTAEQELAEQSFVQHTKRDNSGRFIVRIPLKAQQRLGESFHTAEQRFFSLERKFRRNPKLHEEYSAFMNEYIALGHMKLVTNATPDIGSYYFPHHAVIREQSLTTKIRVVFDGSSKTTSGQSLNDLQYVGPVVQSELYDILIRFRFHKYVLSGDICKMYRQILIDNDQTKLQRILWRSNQTEQLKTFELQTVTYGTAAAPYLATRCLKQLAEEHKAEYPEEASLILNDIYVDDLLTGANSINDLITYKQNITKILKKGCFDLRKFWSNHPVLLETDSNETDPHLTITSDENKQLGILWNANSDRLSYLNTIGETKITKRGILSSVAKIYDPLGLLSPFLMKAKILIQNLWLLKCDWDTVIPEESSKCWFQFERQLIYIKTVTIPRLVAYSPEIEIHGFADASESGYGACVYVKTVDNGGNKHCHLLTSKTRVAPLKRVTLARLELCAAVLLSRLIFNIKQILRSTIKNIYLWSDSTITLSWISKSSHNWKTFVANRVSEIHSNTDVDQWRHVPSKDNPADLLSRGLELESLRHSTLWWHGPLWLTKDESEWPKTNIKQSKIIPEAKNVTTLKILIIPSFEIFSRFSQYNKLIRVTAYIYRFFNNCQIKNKGERRNAELTLEELNTTRKKLIKRCQLESFSDTIQALKTKQRVQSNCRLLALSPYLDNDEILRVGGRLKNINTHQILLDSKHKFTQLIAEHYHQKQGHCSAQTLLYSLREKYWPLGGRNFTRKIGRKCMKCFRANRPRAPQPLMGNLPIERITPAPPFSVCGIDFAGPIATKDRKGRGCKTIKSYFCIFVCFATKAYHIEIVSDLSTESFLAAFKRFIARRGKPANVYSDNGTNFVGANNQINFLANKLTSYFLEENINWHFTPAHSPHFGGLWESGVRSLKTHFQKIIGQTRLTYEELATVSCQIEAILNSRPLTPLTDDPSDLQPLTPGHFLISRPLTHLPEERLTDVPDNRLNRYALCQKLTQQFWQRWKYEYINELQHKQKWRKGSDQQMKVGQLVILRDDNKQPYLWSMARVKELHPGDDGVVRVVTLQLPNKNTTKRAVNRLCVYPVD